MNIGALHMEAAYVDAVQSQNGQSRRKAAGRPASGGFEHLTHADISQRISDSMPPVVEITSNNQGRVSWYQGVNSRTDCVNLFAA